MPFEMARGDQVASLQRQIIEAALALGGFDHASWNHRVEELPFPGVPSNAIGMADWDGTVRYDRQDVIEPLLHLQTNWGSEADYKALRSYREAIATMVHETYHLVAPEGHEHREGRAGFEDPSSRMLEEGATELYTHLRLDDIIRAAGLDRAAPGICDISSSLSYPEFVSGIKQLVTWAGAVTGQGYEALLESLVEQTAAGKHPHLAESLLIHTGVMHDIPAPLRAACRRDLEQAGRSVMDRSGYFPPNLNPASYEQLSLEVGRQSVAAIREALESVKTRFQSESGGRGKRLRRASRSVERRAVEILDHDKRGVAK
jgi:hypothetical protein